MLCASYMEGCRDLSFTRYASFSKGVKKTARLLEGEIIFIFVTLRSMISAGMSNSSTMHSGMAPPQGCAPGAKSRTSGHGLKQKVAPCTC